MSSLSADEEVIAHCGECRQCLLMMLAALGEGLDCMRKGSFFFLSSHWANLGELCW